MGRKAFPSSGGPGWKGQKTTRDGLRKWADDQAGERDDHDKDSEFLQTMAKHSIDLGHSNGKWTASNWRTGEIYHSGASTMSEAYDKALEKIKDKGG